MESKSQFGPENWRKRQPEQSPAIPIDPIEQMNRYAELAGESEDGHELAATVGQWKRLREQAVGWRDEQDVDNRLLMSRLVDKAERLARELKEKRNPSSSLH